MKIFKGNLIIIFFITSRFGAIAQDDIVTHKISENGTSSIRNFCIISKFDSSITSEYSEWNRNIEDDFLVALSRIKHITARKGSPLFPQSRGFTTEQINTRLKKMDIYGLIIVSIGNEYAANDGGNEYIITDLFDTSTGVKLWTGRRKADSQLLAEGNYSKLFEDYTLKIVAWMFSDGMIYDCGCDKIYHPKEKEEKKIE